MMKRLLPAFVFLLATFNFAFSQDENAYYGDCLKPLSEYSATSKYDRKLRKLFLEGHGYEFSCIVTPSFTFEYSIGYDKSSRRLVCSYARRNIWYNDHAGHKKANPVNSSSVIIPEEVGDSLSVLFSLSTESSKYFDESREVLGLDGVTYEFSHSNGITATCWSPKADNTYRLANLVDTICKEVKGNNVQAIVSLHADICSLIDDFRKVISESKAKIE